MSKFAITYRKWNNASVNNEFVGEMTTDRKFTKREAIAHLKSNGFIAWGNTKRKLPNVFTNGNGIMAYILK